MKKTPKGIRLLKLKLDPSCYPELERIGCEVRKARNAALEDWLLRQRGKPPSEKQNRDVTESTKIYHAVTAAAPCLDTQVASTLAQAIASHLSTKLDWRRGAGEGEKRRKRSDAILAYEDRPPFFSSLEIPVRTKTSGVVFGPRTYLTAQFERGHKIECDILTAKLPVGHKRLIAGMADGTLKRQDSRLVCKDGVWYWYATMAESVEPCHADRVLRLSCVFPADEDARRDRPFLCEYEDAKWYVGEGRYYVAQLERLWNILKQIGWQYRQRNGTGHGRQKYDRATSLRRKQMRDVASEFRRKVIVGILSQCERWRCGTIEYREPSLPAREKSWLGVRGVDWDWTRFLGDLKNAAGRRGIEVCKSMQRLKDVG